MIDPGVYLPVMDTNIKLDTEGLFKAEMVEEENETSKGRKFIKRFEKNLTKLVECRLKGKTGDC